MSRSSLPNGLEVHATELPAVHDATVIFAVRAGSRYEPPATNGISHVLEHMMFRGAAAYPSPRELNLAVEELGGTLDAATHVDFTTYELTLPGETFFEGVARFGRILEAPLLLDLALEKKILREELLEDLDEDGRDIDIDNLSRRLLYGSHGLGHTITGTLDGIEKLTEADLRAYLDAHYVGRNAVVAAAGPFDPAAFHALVHGRFAFLRPGDRTHAIAPASGYEDARDRYAFVHDPGSQSDVRVSFPAFGESHPDLVALDLLGRVLDDGMGSRLPHRLRDQLGLVYDAFASIDPYEDVGVFDLGGSVAHAKVSELVRELVGLTDALRSVPVPADELERVRRRYLWDLDRMLDDAHSMASFHAMRTMLGSPHELEDLRRIATNVTADELVRVAKDVFRPSRARVAVVGGMSDRASDKLRSLVADLAK